MGNAARVLSIATTEAELRVAWKTHEARILEYFAFSTGKTDWAKSEALKISWCTYFVHWVLMKAGVQPQPRVGTSGTLGKDMVPGSKVKVNSTNRFFRNYGGAYTSHAVSRTYKPKPGDLYYKRFPHDHIGIVASVAGNRIWSIDGNSGPDAGDSRYELLDGKKVVGGGFIHRTVGSKTLGSDDVYLEIPD